MRLDTNLLQNLPQWYRDIVDYQQLCLAEGKSFEALAQAIHAVSSNFFFQEMDESAVSQWEKVFHIVPDPVTESLIFRRNRLLNRISIRPPFSLGFLYQKLDELIGKDQWTVRVDYPNYTLYVESSAENQEYATEVLYTIGKIKPAHIVFRNTPYTESGLQLSESISLTNIIYNYRLGGWGLGTSPFSQEEDQGVIKMPEIPSIQAEMLHAVAGFVSGDIAAARVNGTTVISALTKSVAENIATVEYTVAPKDTAAISKVELLDAEGNVLTESTVYVPVTDPVIMKHRIPVNEGGRENG